MKPPNEYDPSSNASRSIRSRFHRVLDALAERFIFPADGFTVTLVDPPVAGSPMAYVSPVTLWQRHTLREKLQRLVARRWVVSDAELLPAADAVFLGELYGTSDDAGEAILDLMTAHWNTEHAYDQLTDHDRKRADALRAYTLATLQRFRNLKFVPPLNLQLLRRSPLMCTVLNPMMLKIPVTSVQFFLDVHVHFAFNKIRRSGHPQSNMIVSLLYEVLFLQQKIAVTLKDLLEHIVAIAAKGGGSLLILSETDAIRTADLLFVYAKASVEKTVALVGYTLEISLENKKTQKKRYDALRAAFPEEALRTPYGALLLEFVSSDALEELNVTRTGLLHKMGIAELQPHNYVGAPGDAVELRKLFTFLHDQHAKNTMTLLAALALLTDDLMRRDPPALIPEHVMRIHDSIFNAVTEAMKRATGTNSPPETAG